jgi:hypothetical protein
MQAGYEKALADAASALVDTTAGATDAETRTALARISANLTAYTGLVASAEANNRQKFVVGSSYFRQASALMQNELLPGAESIFSTNLARLDEDQRAVGSTPALSLGLLGLVLAFIGAVSVALSRLTNRQFNLGLVVAGALVVVVMIWIVVATHFAARSIDLSRTDGTTRFARLGNARIVAEQARTDENLELIAHTAVTSGEASFTGHIDRLRELLAAGPAEASEAVTKWTAAHDKQVHAYDNGDYIGAVAQALGTESNSSATQFALVETSVRSEIERTRSTLREQVSEARAWLAWSPTGTLVLMVLAATAAVAGLWPRLKEFL